MIPEVVTQENDIPFPFEDEGTPQDETPAKDLVAVEHKPTLDFLEPANVPDLDAMEAGMNIAPTYWEVEDKGATLRAVLIGWSQMASQQGGTIPLAVLQNKQGIWTNAGSNLVQQLRNLSVRTPVEIVYEGKEKTNSGNQVKKFTVRLLNPKPAPQVPQVNVGPGVNIPSKKR